MLKSDKTKLELNEIQQRAAELSGKEDRTEAEETEFLESPEKYKSLLKRQAAEVVAEGTTEKEAPATKETVEFSELCSDYQVTRSLSGKELDGVEAEVHQELVKRAGNIAPEGSIAIPFEALETRADTVTTTSTLPGTDPLTIDPVLARLFPESIASRIGIEVRSVARGSLSLPVIEQGASIQWVAEAVKTAKNDSQGITTTQVTSTAKTYTANIELSAQAMKLGSSDIETSMRGDLRMAVVNGLDTAVLVGTGTGNQPKGIVTSLTAEDISANALDYAALVNASTSLLNDNYVVDYNGIRVAIRPEALAYLTTTMADVGSGIRQITYLEETFGGIATTNKFDDAAASKSSVLLATPGNASLVNYGGGIFAITDPYTKSSQGITRITLMGFADLLVKRLGGYKLLTVKHSA